MIGLIALMATVSRAGIKADPAFALARQLVGGSWSGKVGAMDVEFHFWLEHDGQLIRGHGTGRQGKKVVVTMESSYGWDAAAKQPYYLDQHNQDTVYFGHIHAEGQTVVTEFKGLATDGGVYLSKEHFDDPNTYTFQMWAREGEKLTDIHVRASLHRKRT